MFDKWVSWGATAELGSHRHILRHYYKTAQKMGIQAKWLPDVPDSRLELAPGTVVFVWDVCAKNIGDAVPGVLYVTHNMNGDDPLCQTVEPEKILRLQVYTDDAAGEEWLPFRLYHREWQTLFQPWGTDLLPEEFAEPTFSAVSRDVPWVGAVWSDQYEGEELGNEAMITELKQLCADNRLHFVHVKHVSDDENMGVVRAARIAPAFAGGWQVSRNYLPCRVFKNISYGALGVTNVPELRDAIGCRSGSLAQQFMWALSMRRHDYVDLTREQQKFAANYSYRDSLLAINRAFEEQNAF